MSKLEKFVVKAPLEEKIGEEQRGKITIGSQIIRQLSKSVYSSSEMAIKELISNAFDADATEVTIDSKTKPNCIIIHDDGSGMDYKDFDDKFAVISRSPKASTDFTPIYKRPMIGRLGIGFIAVSDLCNTMIISSTTKDSDLKFIATIDFSKFKRKDAPAKDFYEVSDYTLTNYRKEKKGESYTHIELRDLSPAFKNILLNKPEKGAKSRNFKNPNFSTIIKKIWNTPSHLEIGKIYGPYWKFVTHLASIVPVEYLKSGPIDNPEYSEMLNPIKNSVKQLNFKVIFDGMQLKKPYLFPTKNAKQTGKYTVFRINDEIDIPGRGKIVYDGYAYGQNSGIFVDDWRGLIVRVKNTAVGTISQNFLDYPHLDSMYFKWTFAEIYVSEGLDEAMNIDRATFKNADPEYFEFSKSLHDKLQSIVFNSMQKIWRAKVKEQSRELEDYKKKWRHKSLTAAFKKKFEIKTSKKSTHPVSISLKDAVVLINPDNPILEKFPRKERELLKDVILAATIAREKYTTNARKQESYFFELLENLAKNYPKQGLKFKYQRRKNN